MYRAESLLQEHRLIGVIGEETPASRRHVSVLIVVAVYFSYLLGQCSSNGVFGAERTADNYSMAENGTEMLPSGAGQPDDGLHDRRHQGKVYHTEEPSYQLTSGNRSLYSTTGETLTSAEYLSNVVLPVSVTNGGRHQVTSTTQAYTRRNIYIRGHLLHHPPPAPRNINPKSDSGTVIRDFSSPNDSRNEDPDGANSRRKRKHSSTKARYYNYKMLYDTIKDSGSGKKKTEFYAWIFGAAMLGLGSLTTVSSCFVFCFCSDKVRKRREARTRRGKDKAGEYQRVESVSSIVDHAGEHSEFYEEQMDSVTII